MAKGLGRTNQDENNNEDNDNLSLSSKSGGLFIERHLELGQTDGFLIIPNGGSGDCMFKAVSQAVYNGDESKHRKIRKKVVEFIISEKWEKFSEFIEVQHINGNNLLQRQWSKDPKQAYKMYMSLPGTLGSSSELTAAAELYQYNFATVQEYCNNSQRTYRVENCILFDQNQYNFHYFYFTGEYDNGHWEYMRSLTEANTTDGTYHGRHKTMIEGEEITIEAWLQRETENTNSADRLKVYTNRSLFVRRLSSYPFALGSSFQFEKDGTVKIKENPYTIEDINSTDLFTVLAHACSSNEGGSAHETELVLIKNRYSYFEDINYKLMTQPWSHNFTTEAIKYSGYPCKGNIQDLICAAGLFSFSFVLFMKFDDSAEVATTSGGGSEVHECQFTHVDRWGGENEKTLYFFMRLAQAENNAGPIAKWWLLNPYNRKSSSSQAQLSRKSRHGLDGDENINLPAIQAIPKVSSVQMVREDARKLSSHYDIVISPRPMTGDMIRNSPHGVPSRPLTSKSASPYLDFDDDEPYHQQQQRRSLNEVRFANSNENVNESKENEKESSTSSEEELELTDNDLQRDFENIFGSEAPPVQVYERKVLPSSLHITPTPETQLVTKKIKSNKMKPATGRDLAKRPEKVRTVVKVRDSNNSGREITYQGSGYMKAGDVLDDLRKQGLIKMVTTHVPDPIMPATIRRSKEFSFDKLFMAVDKESEESGQIIQKRDANYNVLKNKKSAESVISYENDGREKKQFQSSSDQHEQVFSRAIHSYMNVEQPKIKRNKVSPTPSDIHPEPTTRETAASTDNTGTANASNPCLAGLLILLEPISVHVRRLSRMIKRGFRRRYDRYHRSSSIFDFSSVRGPRQSSSHSNNRVEPILTTPYPDDNDDNGSKPKTTM